jgi:hypothetical protein
MRTPDLAEELEAVLQKVLSASSKDSSRQSPLAGYLIRRLREKLPPHLHAHLRQEVAVPGLAREKRWDIGLVYPEEPRKPRLLLSLKSILANPAGSWPNRLDDLVGEVSSIQMRFPEVVVGYVAILDRGALTKKRRKISPTGGYDFFSFKKGLNNLAQRRPPLGFPGLIEAFWGLEIDSRTPGSTLLFDPGATVEEGEKFLDTLVQQLWEREPLLFGG